MVYLSHRAELTVRLDICRKVSRSMSTRGCDRVVTLGLSSLGTQPCPNAGTMEMVVTPHACGVWVHPMEVVQPQHHMMVMEDLGCSEQGILPLGGANLPRGYQELGQHHQIFLLAFSCSSST